MADTLLETEEAVSISLPIEKRPVSPYHRATARWNPIISAFMRPIQLSTIVRWRPVRPRNIMYALVRGLIAVARGIGNLALSPFFLDMMAHHMRSFLSGRGIGIDKVKNLVLGRLIFGPCYAPAPFGLHRGIRTIVRGTCYDRHLCQSLYNSDPSEEQRTLCLLLVAFLMLLQRFSSGGFM